MLGHFSSSVSNLLFFYLLYYVYYYYTIFIYYYTIFIYYTIFYYSTILPIRYAHFVCILQFRRTSGRSLEIFKQNNAVVGIVSWRTQSTFAFSLQKVKHKYISKFIIVALFVIAVISVFSDCAPRFGLGGRRF